MFGLNVEDCKPSNVGSSRLCTCTALGVMKGTAARRKGGLGRGSERGWRSLNEISLISAETETAAECLAPLPVPTPPLN